LRSKHKSFVMDIKSLAKLSLSSSSFGMVARRPPHQSASGI
jgi:hypothetical protein